MSQITDLIVLGAGNPDIVRLIEDINEYKKTFNFIGFLEKNSDLHGKTILGYPVLGDDNLLETEFKKCQVVNNIFHSADLHVKITSKLKDIFQINSFPSLIHPRVNTRHVKIGIGNIIYDNVSLGVNTSFGNFNIIFYGSVIGHETSIGNHNLIAANVSVGARCNIGNKVIMGNGSVLNGNINICDDVFIGLGSVVVNTITEPQKLFGNPAKVFKF